MCERLEGSGSQGERDKVLCYPYIKLWVIVKPEQGLEELSDPQGTQESGGTSIRSSRPPSAKVNSGAA